VALSGRPLTSTVTVSPGSIVVGDMVTEADVAAAGIRRRSRIRIMLDLVIRRGLLL
jgi:hypothetical protein